VSCVKLLNWVIWKNILKRGRLKKSDVRSRNKRSVYNLYKFFEGISHQRKHLSNINVHKAQEMTAEACGVGYFVAQCKKFAIKFLNLTQTT
jgi:hypothetical protein